LQENSATVTADLLLYPRHDC